MARGSLLPKALGSSAIWFATAASGFVITGILYRECGEGAFGVWATIVSLRALLMLLDAGLLAGVSRDAALLVQGDGAAWGRIRAAWRLYAGLAAGALLLGCLGGGLPGALLGVPPELQETARWTTILCAAEASVALLFGPLQGLLRGRERFGLLALSTGAQAVVGIALLLGPFSGQGLVGAAWGLLIARVAVQGLLFFAVRRSGLFRRPEGTPDDAAHPRLGVIAEFARPLWFSALGTWLAHMIDVPMVGAWFGEDAAGHFALGTRIAGACSGLLFGALSATFPSFVTAERETRHRQGSSVLFLACSLAAGGFGTLAVCAEPVLRLWVGAAPELAQHVLLIYACFWAINAPAHVLASMAIAANRHRVLQRVVLVTVPVNLLGSIVLASLGLRTGPAIASLATLAVSNWLVLPLLLLPRMGLRPGIWLRPAFLGYATGAAVAAGVWLLTGSIEDPLTKLLVSAALLLCGLGVLLDLSVRQRSSLRLAWRRLVRGGYRVQRRQARETRLVGRTMLAEGGAPEIFSPQSPPLVSVRIATYNRGPLVAERALASAIRQTHKNLEIIVVGDCCDAATEAAVRSVDDPRVRFVNLPERGRYPDDPELRWMVAGSIPMAHGVAIAQGDWIAPLDDDDEFTDDHVEVLLEACLSRRLDFAYGAADMEDGEGRWGVRGGWPLRRGVVCHSAVLYSRRLAPLRHDVESWRLDDPADWNLWSRFQETGARIGYVDRVVARHYAERRGVPVKRPLWLSDVERAFVEDPEQPAPLGS